MEVNNNHITKERLNYRLISHAIEYMEQGIILLKQALEREKKLLRNGEKEAKDGN